MTLRNSTWSPEGRFNGYKRLPASLRGTSTENRDHNNPRTPRDIQGALRKPRSQVPRPSRGSGLRPEATSQRSPTRQKENRVTWVTRSQPCPNDVPFRSTTLPSCAITFQGFLTTLTIPHEEVVAIRGPIHRAQPPFHSFFFTGFLVFIPNFLSLFRVRLGLCTFGSVHSHLDLPLRSPRSSTSHHAVTGASVPTHFPRAATTAPLSGHSTCSSKPSLATLKAASPTLFLLQRG
ncbi:hypothetical protein CRG98_032489 [Punica granatum]|uniref:Uncharacterized protein n=1 Tax=Punica granatum TaxID=22663 RepID=A0A2I0ITZ4_PUNGR|nr:hypothetical protein CRG98_032489 [Punica granatum]